MKSSSQERKKKNGLFAKIDFQFDVICIESSRISDAVIWFGLVAAYYSLIWILSEGASKRARTHRPHFRIEDLFIDSGGSDISVFRVSFTLLIFFCCCWSVLLSLAMARQLC